MSGCLCTVPGTRVLYNTVLVHVAFSLYTALRGASQVYYVNVLYEYAIPVLVSCKIQNLQKPKTDRFR